MSLTATGSGKVYQSYPILPFGFVACTLFPTTFLKIAVFEIIQSVEALMRRHPHDAKKGVCTVILLQSLAGFRIPFGPRVAIVSGILDSL